MHKQIIEKLTPFKKLSDLLEQRQRKVFVSPLEGSFKSLFVQSFFRKGKQILLLTSSLTELKELSVELALLGLSDDLIVLEDFEGDVVQEKLTDISNRKSFILVSTYELLKEKFPSRDALGKSTTKVEIGGELPYDQLIEYLNLINYDQDKYVDQPGEYALRGSIIDFWSYSEKLPCRVEFDGDFIESIRYFDPESQRSTQKVDSVTLASSCANGEMTADIFDYLESPFVIASDYYLANLTNINDSNKNLTDKMDDLDEDLKYELYEYELENYTYKKDEVKRKNELRVESLFDKDAFWVLEDHIGIHEERINLGLSEAPYINSNYELLFSSLKNYAAKEFEIVVAVENQLQIKRLSDLFTEYDEEIQKYYEQGLIKIIELPIKSGFAVKEDRFLLMTDYQIFNKPYRTRLSEVQKKVKRVTKKSKTRDLANLKIGDYVVHENFGIGQYAGLQTIKIGNVEQESIKILYAEGGVVYVNLNYLSLVKKYSSSDNVKPNLSVLGSGEWKSTKKKVKSKIKEAARQLITLYAKRKMSKGFAFSPDTIWQKELEASFIYEDTPDQARVTEEIKNDMENETPMDRLVCGDVGFGKTEIAVRAAFKAVNDNKQVALLVPTTILAEQHYNTFRDRLVQFPVRIEVLSRFRSPKEQKEIVEKLARGEVDIIIGTHRLLSKDISFRDLGLLIIDEEHRFGVMAKEKLRALKANVDTLTLTATPIPRTLNLSLLGARDLSIIATPPPNRQPIFTKVDSFDIQKIREWVLSEIKRGGQIYFIHDRVQSIEKIAAYIKKHIPEIKVGIAHGKLKPAQLEKVIHDFVEKKYDMLISTKIIESGIDIPSVNTIIVNRADRFGLAELHQLRGRVGRSNRQAYAYFLVPSVNTITKKAFRRLQAIEEYTELGEGFSLSMRDLEIRGAGNLLGTEQSGFIDSVGFDLYLKLVDEAVEELKESEFKEIFRDLPKQIERSEPAIDTYFEIGIPADYMPDQSDRLGFYTSLFSMVKIDETEEIIEELEDRFGKIPPVVKNLIDVARLRFYASLALWERIIIQQDKVIVVLPKGNREEYYKNKFVPILEYINSNFGKRVRFVQQKELLKLEITNDFKNPEDILKFMITFTQRISELTGEYHPKAEVVN
ncbi:transcription-repair coupling factor [Melioribacter sp. OK-6-Me]|uniref:transcription-repair coupling factor n=1 Tax=unclassified Melioribacter TaxID=2627329 RepID=UPI003EDA9135